LNHSAYIHPIYSISVACLNLVDSDICEAAEFANTIVKHVAFVAGILVARERKAVSIYLVICAVQIIVLVLVDR
jgi:hypothetical protein